MTTAELDALEALEREATPGPWTTGALYRCHIWGPGDRDDTKAQPVCTVKKREEQDGAFIRALRNAAPALIEAARENERRGKALERIANRDCGHGAEDCEFIDCTVFIARSALSGAPEEKPSPDLARAAIFSRIDAERKAQDAKWGQQNHEDGTGSEAAQAMANYLRALCQSQDKDSWMNILAEEVAEAFAEAEPAALRKELIQSAAVIVAWIECAERRAARGPA